MDVLDLIKKLVLGSAIIVAGHWLLFGRTQLQRQERDEEHVTELLKGTTLREGDLIFQTSLSAQSKAIQLATRSPYSHCGILYKTDGHWSVYEAAQTVRMTPLRNWVYRGKDEHFVVKRLRDASTALNPAAVARLDSVGRTFRRREYDSHFGWSDDRIYCSELVWKVYERGLGRQLGQLQQLRDFDLSHPTVQAKMKERYGSRLPLSESVISPVSIFTSPELVMVLRR